jgi:hypothetical protein
LGNQVAVADCRFFGFESEDMKKQELVEEILKIVEGFLD